MKFIILTRRERYLIFKRRRKIDKKREKKEKKREISLFDPNIVKIIMKPIQVNKLCFI